MAGEPGRPQPFQEEDLLPLSALQHLLFCERQAALLHVEQLWAENPLTVEGRHLHERVDAVSPESRGGVHLARALPLRCLRLGLSGRADLVEFHRLAAGLPGVSLPGLPGTWQPFPVEFKRGRPKSHSADRVQLCAQALCLEEMLGQPVPAGALYYGQTRRRRDVPLDAALRRETEAAAERLHRLLGSGVTPPPVREPKCEACSLLPLCLPDAPAHSARRFLARALRTTDDPRP
ncbi:MAG TPA: CRISPR-associated protein Cas4 [Thermoanaerobaculia bacterium]|nr:CRISPR-associated protein Cas4 [Thermoanaerobaculia bacterium]